MAHPPIDSALRREIEEIFEGAIELEPSEREGWLNARCGANALLRAEVNVLIAAHERAEGILEGKGAVAAVSVLRDPNRDRRIGPYRVLRELGRGGMGVVYLAERVDGMYRQRVALKLLRASPDADELHRRFLAERQILASLNHPNIAQLLDGGVTDGQLPFLVMEYVDGVPITTYCDRRQLGVEERLRLFRDVCAAAHHAHQNLVIHRDIKPGNILVTEDGRVKLLDFGIAKLLNPTLGPADQPLTRTEFRAMTPEYASPEQIRGESLTTSSDVYALGVVLYELLSGRRPHRFTSSAAHEMAQVISNRDPQLPSVAARRSEPPSSDDRVRCVDPEGIAVARGLTVERLQRRLRGDLDAIVMMALRKEPTRRYGSADLLWEDLQRHLDGLPVLADHGTRWYRAKKFLGRHRIESVAAAVVLLSLAVGTTVALRQAAVARHERDRAEQALGQSKAVSDFLVGLFRARPATATPNGEATASDLLAAGTSRVEQLSGQPLVQAQMLDALGRVNQQLGRYNDAEGMLRRALDLRRSQPGADPLDIATSLSNLATVIRVGGKKAEATRLYREALEIQQRILGPRHIEVAQALTNLGIMMSNNPVAAESLFRAARDIQRSALGPDDPGLTYNNLLLAGVLRERKAIDEAEGLYRENLAITQRRLGPQDPATAAAMVRLGSFLYRERKRPAEAESLYNRALVVLRPLPVQSQGPLMGVLADLTHLYADRGDFAKAEVFAREALDAERRGLGPQHPTVSQTMSLLAAQWAAQGRYAEADSLLRDAIGLVERGRGPQDVRVASILIALANVRSAMGRRAEAETDLRRALAIYERAENPPEVWVGVITVRLAELTARRGAKAESDAFFARSASLLRSLPPQTEPEVQAAYTALADHYKALRQPGDEEHFRRLALAVDTKK